MAFLGQNHISPRSKISLKNILITQNDLGRFTTQSTINDARKEIKTAMTRVFYDRFGPILQNDKSPKEAGQSRPSLMNSAKKETKKLRVSYSCPRTKPLKRDHEKRQEKIKNFYETQHIFTTPRNSNRPIIKEIKTPRTEIKSPKKDSFKKVIAALPAIAKYFFLNQQKNIRKETAPVCRSRMPKLEHRYKTIVNQNEYRPALSYARAIEIFSQTEPRTVTKNNNNKKKSTVKKTKRVIILPSDVYSHHYFN